MALPLMLAAGGSILSGVSGILGGFQQKKAAKANALGAQIEAQMAMIRGKQIGERSREDLATALGNIESIRSSRGVNLDSQTGQAIERRTVQDAYRDEAVAVMGELNRASNAQMAARGFKSQARWALPMAVVNSAGSFMQAGSFLTMPKPGA
ncbi:hypothetical protein [Brevundimonas diminuta]|uniref:hypothetical protein n=1 Tax=Brevundimonas diminuta TaxID=293 RepID=UPI003D9A294B